MPGEIEAARAGDRRRTTTSRSPISGADMSRAPRTSPAWSRKPKREFGGVDILVNNAGIQYVAPIEEFPIEKWNAILAINLSGAFHAIRLAAARHEEEVLGPHRQHRLGACAGRLAFQVAPMSPPSTASPGLTKTVALEAAEHRHHRQCGLPRLCADAAGGKADPRTGQGARHHRDSGDPRRAARGPADQALRHRRRSCRPSVNFLCSDDARLDHRAQLPVDGGWTAH